MVTLVAEPVHSETEPKKVPAPIPAVNVWQVNKLNTPQTTVVNGNNMDSINMSCESI